MRRQARENGLLRYFGKICKRHPELNGERQTLDAHCPECRRAKNMTSYRKHGEVRRATSRQHYHENIEQERARGRAQSKKHRKRLTAYKRKWTEANKERIAAVNRAYQEANREQLKAYQHAYYLRNKKHISTRVKLNRANNKERYDTQATLWRENNKAHWKALMKNRRGRERGALGRFTKNDIQILWDKQGGVCAAIDCVVTLETSCTVDHMTPLSRGGSNWPSNLQLLCKSCNCSKGAKTMDEWICAGEAA